MKTNSKVANALIKTSTLPRENERFASSGFKTVKIDSFTERVMPIPYIKLTKKVGCFNI